MAGDPRIRGEHEDKRYADWDRAGSSPHTRGARAHRLLKPSGVCIIPAYAGSTTSSPTRWRRPKDHPRIRGEHSSWSLTPFTISGSSPHTRGARAHRLLKPSGVCIIPAYAGSTTSPAQRLRAETNHPRIRGEHVRAVETRLPLDGSSPHTRGARRRPACASRPRGIIPAYAGSTGTAPSGLGNSGDHPRIRGEHPKGITRTRSPAGSSPHTRGAPEQRRRPSRGAGIIPAYAGSTG